jgi:hypothetical protein
MECPESEETSLRRVKRKKRHGSKRCRDMEDTHHGADWSVGAHQILMQGATRLEEET